MLVEMLGEGRKTLVDGGYFVLREDCCGCAVVGDGLLL